MGRLENKVAIITGAASGMGAVTARLFAKEGANVIGTDVNIDALNEINNKINDEFGETMIGVQQDVTNEEDWKKVIEQGITKFGKIDVLVNNAGIGGSTDKFEDYQAKDWDKEMSVDAKSVLLGIKYVSPKMRENGSGSIINISSLAAQMSLEIASIGYSAAKGAIRSLSKKAAGELATDNIRVNSILPGYILTELMEKTVDQSFIDNLANRDVPLNRFGKPLEVAYASVYLASDESSFTTGTEFIIDGGQSSASI